MTPLDLRVWRTRQELTQANLATRLGVHTNTVNRWECGDTAIPAFLPLALETLERQPVQNGTNSMPKRKTASPAKPATPAVSAVDEGEHINGLPDGDNVAAAKCNRAFGRWYCATHTEGFANQLQKDIHIDDDRSHRLAWLCSLHGVEVP